MMRNLSLIISAALITVVAASAMAQLTPLSSGVTPIAPTHPAATQMHLNDDVLMSYGNTAAVPDFSCQWDTAQTPDAMICGGGSAADVILDNGAWVSYDPTATSWTGDCTIYDNNGVIGCQRPTDVAPQGILIRAQPAFAGGTQTASIVTICGGQDETTTAIDGADPSVSCADDNDTITVTVFDSNGASTATILTEGTDWTASASVADTCTSLATAVNNLAGVGATCTSPNVRFTLDANTCRVNLAESTAGCTTISSGTAGEIFLRGSLVTATSALTSTSTFTVTGIVTTATGIFYALNDQNLGLGTTAGAATRATMQYDTGQTPDGVVFAVPTTSRVFTFFEAGDEATDFAKAQQTNPTVCVQSADAATTADRICIAHDQTDAVISSDSGDILLSPAGGDIGTTGDIGIGTNTPTASVKLDILSTGSTTHILTTGDNTVSTTLYRANRTTGTASATIVTDGANNAVMTLYDAGEVADVVLSTVGVSTIANGFATPAIEANLVVGACTAGQWRVDNTVTRELCRCNDAGTAYDCINVTTANGPTD